MALALTLLLAMATPGDVPAPPTATRVVVVRHAEKDADGSPDPGLSEAGRQRAAALAARLAGRGLDVAYATPYRRTQQTAAPAAAAAGIAVTVVAIGDGGVPAHVQDLARRIRALPAGSRVLVVGHSNTVPALVQALGAEAEAMPEDEYDRYTEIRLGPGGDVQVERTRY